VEAISKAPAPKNVTELRSFLEMINYYSKFIPNLATTLHPLHVLLRDGVKWHWSEECAKSFTKFKNHLIEAPVLVHCDPKLPVRLAGDASNYGIGAVLSHVDTDGQEHPIAFMSRTVTSTKRTTHKWKKKLYHLFLESTNFAITFTAVTLH